jgi:ABC-2 type transport system permease protein
MEKIKVIILFEYISNVRRLSFWVGTFIIPVAMLFFIALSIIFATLGAGERRIVILDQSGIPGLYDSIKKKNAEVRQYTFSQVVVSPDEDIDQFRRRYTDQITSDTGTAYIVLRQGIVDGVSPEYYAGGGSDLALEILDRNISSAVIDQRLANAGLDAELFMKPLNLKRIKVSPTGEAQEGITNLVAAAFLFIFTLLSFYSYGSRVMTGIIEEKDTRIIEVMVSSAKSFELMMGKLIGIGLVGLTQYLIWLIFAVPIFLAGKPVLASIGVTLNLISISTVVCIIVYYVLGYFMSASIYVIGGALATDIESGNIVTRFMPIISMLHYLTLWAVIQNPSGKLALILSAIPLFTAGTMILRIAMSSPPLWQILLSFFLMLAAIAIAIRVAAKIYRVGILIYGKKLGLREIIRWLRYT